jgi:dimethylargininase
MDVGLAFRQHAAYLDVLVAHGWQLWFAPDLDDHPDGLFVEDALLAARGNALLTRPGADSRRGEVESMHGVVSDLGLRCRRIVEPGTLDGGDVLIVGDDIFCGRTTRSNDDGRAQLAAWGEPLGFTTTAVEVTGCLHLKSAVTALPDGSLIAVPGWVDPEVFAQRALKVHQAAEPTGGDVLCLGDTVVLPASAPATADRIAALGFRVHPLDVGELEKIEAGVTCMSVLVGS